MRNVFDFSKVPLIHWYPGHMSASLKHMKELFSKEIDYVFEVRDARVKINDLL